MTDDDDHTPCHRCTTPPLARTVGDILSRLDSSSAGVALTANRLPLIGSRSTESAEEGRARYGVRARRPSRRCGGLVTRHVIWPTVQ